MPSPLSPLSKHKRLPLLTNKQSEQVDRIVGSKTAHAINECPTCRSKAVEVGEGVWRWPESTYYFLGQRHDCDCAQQVDLFRHYVYARIPEDYMRLDWQDWKGDDEAWKQAQDYVDNWDKLRRYGLGCGFYSETLGTGKTMLATYIAREVIKKRASAYFVRFRSLFTIMEWEKEERFEAEERIRESTLLVLDEISEPISDKQGSFYATIIEDLIRQRTDFGKPTILTTNLEPDQLDGYYPRTFSLLSAKQRMISVTGGDIRRGDGALTFNEELALNDETRPIK